MEDNNMWEKKTMSASVLVSRAEWHVRITSSMAGLQEKSSVRFNAFQKRLPAQSICTSLDVGSVPKRRYSRDRTYTQTPSVVFDQDAPSCSSLSSAGIVPFFLVENSRRRSISVILFNHGFYCHVGTDEVAVTTHMHASCDDNTAAALTSQPY